MNDINDLSGMISKLTENPEVMKSLMGIAGSLSGNDSNKNDSFEKNDRFDDRKKDRGCIAECRDDEKDDCVRHKRERGNDAENLIRLLIALKPYVSADRCEKIDSIVKILKLVQLSEKSGLLKSLL
ncbi:MAG: hypothetical protein E7615_05200 [Ruminococcaceae bacterium]|nr:hypothetical protein [Oscillospiraceae bacterium]